MRVPGHVVVGLCSHLGLWAEEETRDWGVSWLFANITNEGIQSGAHAQLHQNVPWVIPGSAAH